MPKTTDNFVVNGNAGAFVDVPSSIPARKLELREDPVNGSAAGIDYKLPEDNFTAIHSITATELLTLGNTISHGNAVGPVLAYPAQNGVGNLNSIAAGVYAKIRSHGAGATKARFVETE